MRITKVAGAGPKLNKPAQISHGYKSVRQYDTDNMSPLFTGDIEFPEPDRYSDVVSCTHG